MKGGKQESEKDEGEDRPLSAKFISFENRHEAWNAFGLVDAYGFVWVWTC